MYTDRSHIPNGIDTINVSKSQYVSKSKYAMIQSALMASKSLRQVII